MDQLTLTHTEGTRYSASFQPTQSGPYSVVVFANPNQSPLQAEVHFRNLQEYADQGPNLELLSEIASLGAAIRKSARLYESVADAEPFGDLDVE